MKHLNKMSAIKCLITLLCCGYSIAQIDEFLEQPAFLFLSNGQVCRYDYDDITSAAQITPNVTCRYSGAGIHFSMDVREGYMYFIVFPLTGGSFALRFNLAPDSEAQVLSQTLQSVSGVAFDWMGKNLFWNDYVNGMIVVYNIHTLSYMPLVSGIPSIMYGLAVDVPTGRIFWSDISPSISYAQIGSPERHPFITTGISDFVTELCIDTTDRRLYWVDNTMLKIQSVDISTNTASDVRELASFTDLITGLTVSEDYVFWTDYFGVHVIQKANGIRVTDFVLRGDTGDAFLNGLYIQPHIANGCDSNNGGCEHICAPAPSSDKICMCKFGFTLAADGTSCVSEILTTDFLIFTDSYYQAIFQVSVNGGEPHAVDLPIKLERPIAIDYDPDTGFVYFSDVGLKTVYKFYLNNPSSVQTLGQFNQTSTIDGITIDPYTNKLYLTDTGNDVIYRMDDDGANLAYFLSAVDNPRAIVLEHQSGYVYWTDWSDTNPRIERALMVDGSNRESLVTGNLQFPNGLVLDVQANKMYWCDAGTDVIGVSDLAGGSRSVLTSVDGHHFGMIILGDFIYMTDWEQTTVKKIHKVTGVVTPEDYGLFGRPNGIDGSDGISSLTTPTTPSTQTTTSSSTHSSTKSSTDNTGNDCKSQPCRNGATCNDQVNSYICQCDEGWTGTYCEVDVNECAKSPCLNGGSCQNTPGRFKCTCTEEWAGTNCQIQLIADPVVNSAYPNKGPVAGGTLITVYGDNLPASDPIVVLIGTLDCITTYQNETTVIALSPLVNENDASVVGMDLSLSVELSGGKMLGLKEIFMYKGNPKIESFHPTKTIVIGGTQITVFGINLDAVAAPALNIIVTYYKAISKDPIQYNVTVTTYEAPCEVKNVTQMQCQTPEIELPDGFEIEYDRGFESNNGESRRKRNTLNFEYQNGDDRLTFYVGFVLDGVQDYQNFSSIEVYPEPTFNFLASSASHVQKYVPGHRLEFSGDSLDVGIIASDYRIDIGKAVCGSLKLLSNSLSCMPPGKKPQMDPTNPQPHPKIIINVGLNMQHSAGYLEYPDTVKLYIVIPAVIVSVMVIISIAIITVGLLRRKRRQRNTGP